MTRHRQGGMNPALLGICLAVLLAGCAGTPPPPPSVDPEPPVARDADQTTANPLAIYDPLEPFNQRVYRFNALADRYVLLPALDVYRTVAPPPARQGISNFFDNIGEIVTFANTLLQGKGHDAAVTLGRFLVNSTLGVAGLMDPATDLGLARRDEDFGQTLGAWGMGPGPYLVLPLLGPSTLRDTGGLAADFGIEFAFDPLLLSGNPGRRVAYWTAYALDTRERQDFRYYQTGSPFEYTLVRLIYVNFRALQIER